MANYDASIRINTKVDNQELFQTQKEMDALNKKLDSLYAKGEKLEALGVNKQSKQWKSLKYDVAQTEIKFEDAKDKLEKLNAVNTSKLSDGFEKANTSGKKMLATVGNNTKKSNGLLHIMGMRLRGIALSLLVFNWISKGFNAMVNSMKAGFQNLAKYSTEYNKAMSALKSESATLKNSMAAAFEPVATVIVPYITQLVSWLNTAADTVGRFLAALSGKGTYTRAKKQVLDYAQSLDKAGASAKGALASFDSINVLTSDSATGGSGETTGAGAFEEADVGTDMQAVVDTLTPFRESIDAWIDNLDFEPIITSFENLKLACAPFAGALLTGLKFFLDKVLLPLGSWTIEDLIPAFFNLLAAALGALNVVWVVTQPYLAWLWDNFLAPAASWVGDAVVTGIEGITTALTAFSDWATSNQENMSLVSSIVLGFLAGIILYYATKKIVVAIAAIKTALAAFSATSLIAAGNILLASLAMGAMVAGIIYLSANWDKLSGCQKVITILGALAAAAIACAIAIAIFHTAWSVGIAAAAIVGGLALLGLTAACLKWNGSSTKPDASSISGATSLFGSTGSSPLPALATGGITNRPTTALIGEAGTEAVLPLENNTEWMDVLADKINPSSNRPIYIQVSGQTLARIIGPYISQESARVGTTLRTGRR